MSGIYRGTNSSAIADVINIDGDRGDITVANSGAEWTIDNDVVTFAKIQNLSENTVLGRATAGTGDAEEIACTAAGRALLDDADAAAQRTTLGLNALVTDSNLQGFVDAFTLPIADSPNGFVLSTNGAGALQLTAPGGTAVADIFSGDGVSTTFNLTNNPGAQNNLDISIGGVTQTPGIDYNWSTGTTLNFTTAPPAGSDNILVRYMQGLPIADAESAAWTQDGSGTLQRTIGSKLRESVSVKDFGAIGDGLTDDTIAFQTAVNSISIAGDIYIPHGTYLITNTILCDDKFVSFFGNGISSTIIKYNPAVSGIAFEFRHTVSNAMMSEFNNLSIITNVASAGTAIKISAKLTAANPQINGEDDSLLLNNVHVTQSGTGYWTTFLHSVHNGGVHLSNVSFDNTLTTAQADANVFGVIIENTDTRVSTIRSFVANDIFILRTAVTIKIIGNTARQIESIYISNSELVGISEAAFQVASGQVGAIGFTNVEVDSTKYVIDSRLGNILIARFIGCDFRKGATGGSAVASAMFAIDAGVVISFSGCQMSGYNHVSSNVANKAFLFSNTYNGLSIYNSLITGCSFRNFYYVFGPSLNSKINTSGNTYNTIQGAVLEDDNLDASIALRDGMVSKTLTAALDNTGTGTVTVTMPTGYYGQRWPVAMLQVASDTSTDLLWIRYEFSTSTATSCVFTVKGNTTARTVRFSFIAMGTNEGVVAT
jgi:hypothetical protein